MGTDYSFYVNFFATCALTFFGYIILVLASVSLETPQKHLVRKSYYILSIFYFIA